MRTSIRNTVISGLALLFAGFSGGTLAADQKVAAGKMRADTLYHNYCSVCHGDRGDGRSRARNSLTPPPRDFTAPNLKLGRGQMIAVTRDGKSGTAMAGWKTQLSEQDIAGVVDYIRTTFMNLDTSRGRTLYNRNCAVCHGDRGQGAMWAAGNMKHPPRDFTSSAANKELTRARMISAATHGKKDTAMAGFTTQLNDADIEAVVDYIRMAFMQIDSARISGTSAHGGREKDAHSHNHGATNGDFPLPFPNSIAGNRVRGEKFYRANCATCHGEKGDGQGPRAYFIRPKPASFIDHASQHSHDRPELFNSIAKGKLGSEMPAWEKVISAQEIADVAEYVITAFMRHPPLPGHDKHAK